MSMRQWFSRPLAHFLRLSWMGRAVVWPAGMAGAAEGVKPQRGTPPRPATRITLELLEERVTPQDMLGTLQTGMSLAGVTLLNGQLLTPMTAILRGWSAGQPGLPSTTAAGPSTIARKDPEPISAPQTDLESFDLSMSQGDGSTGTIPTQPAPQADPRTPDNDDSLDDWLNQVGAVLGGAGNASTTDQTADSLNASGGGNGRWGRRQQQSGRNSCRAAAGSIAEHFIRPYAELDQHRRGGPGRHVTRVTGFSDCRCGESGGRGSFDNAIVRITSGSQRPDYRSASLCKRPGRRSASRSSRRALGGEQLRPDAADL